MTPRPDHLFQAEHIALALTLTAVALWLLLGRLRRGRPELAIGAALAVAVGLRFAAAAGLSLIDPDYTLRGPDDPFTRDMGRFLTESPLLSELAFRQMAGELHIWVLGLQHYILETPSDLGMRSFQIGFAVGGIAFVAAAVHDLAGPRASLIFAWLAALEPSGMFFSGLFHREALVFLGEGMVIFGATRLWLDLSGPGTLVAALGAAIVLGSRPYAGWFIVAAFLLVMFHTAMRMRPGRAGRAVLVAGVAVVALLSLLPLANAYKDTNLRRVSISQYFNSVDRKSNLSLEAVDFNTAQGILRGVPIRVRDVLIRPYPWQVENTSQRLGVLATVGAWSLLVLILFQTWRRPNTLFRLGAPLVYPLLLATLGYAFSAGNAGTGFRYRTHLLVLMIALAAVLTARPRRLAAEDRRSPLGAIAPSLTMPSDRRKALA